jgi:hypothetical protein
MACGFDQIRDLGRFATAAADDDASTTSRRADNAALRLDIETSRQTRYRFGSVHATRREGGGR